MVTVNNSVLVFCTGMSWTKNKRLKKINISLNSKHFCFYLKNVLYNATLLKIIKLKLHFIKKWSREGSIRGLFCIFSCSLSKKDAPEYVYMFRIFFILQKKTVLTLKNVNNCKKLAIIQLMSKLIVLLRFFRVRNDFFLKNSRKFWTCERIQAHRVCLNCMRRYKITP